MKIRLWIYSKMKNIAKMNAPCNLKSEEIVDITIEPYGESFFYIFPIAPQLSIRAGNNNPSSLVFVCKKISAHRLPDGNILEVQKNGIVCPEPETLMDTYPITVKDHLEITVTDGIMVQTTHVIVASITQDTPLPETVKPE